MSKIFYIFIFLFVSCGSNQNSVENIIVPPNEKISLKIHPSSNGKPWLASYSTALFHILSEPELSPLLDANIIDEDLELVKCQNLNQLNIENKKLFYTSFLAAIAEAESDFEIDQKTYNPKDNTLNIGLLQIDSASANRHAKEYFNFVIKEIDLIKPEFNLMVGAFILKNQISGKVATNRLFPQPSYYWQVLTTNKERILKNLYKNLRQSNLCSLN